MKRVGKTYYRSICFSVLIIFFINASAMGLGVQPASQNPLIRQEIEAALWGPTLIEVIDPGKYPDEIAELSEETRQRNLYYHGVLSMLSEGRCHGDCRGALLSNGRYLIRSDIPVNSVERLRVMVHEDIEALMQIISEKDHNKYLRIKEWVLRHFPPDKEVPMSLDLYVNHTVAEAFEWLVLSSRGTIYEDDISDHAKKFKDRLTKDPLLDGFTSEFWDREERKNTIRKAVRDGIRFYLAAGINAFEAIERKEELEKELRDAERELRENRKDQRKNIAEEGFIKFLKREEISLSRRISEIKAELREIESGSWKEEEGLTPEQLMMKRRIEELIPYLDRFKNHPTVKRCAEMSSPYLSEYGKWAPYLFSIFFSESGSTDQWQRKGAEILALLLTPDKISQIANSAYGGVNDCDARPTHLLDETIALSRRYHPDEAKGGTGTKDRENVKEKKEIFTSYDIEETLELTFDIIKDSLEDSSRLYIIRYDKNRITPEMETIIKIYADMLSEKSPAEVKAVGSFKRREDLPLIEVEYRLNTGTEVLGRSRVDVVFPDEDPQKHLVRIIGIVNMALAASNLPEGLIPSGDAENYDHIIGFIKRQYMSISEKDLVLEGNINDIVYKLKNLVIELPPARARDHQELIKYYERAALALKAA